MASKTDLITELQFLSDKLSERSRVIAGGIIAIWWATLVGEKAPPMGLNAIALLGPVVCAGLTILFDLMQYAVAYLQNWFALRRVEREKATEFKFNTSSVVFKLRNALFAIKQLTALIAACWLIVVLLQKFWS